MLNYHKYKYYRRVYRKCPISVSTDLSAIRSQVSGILLFSNGPQGKQDEAVYVHAMNAYRVSRNIAPFILNLSARWRSDLQSLTSCTAPVPTEEKAGWAPEPVRTNCRRESLLPLPELELWILQTVA
jgi:hypothetical protein